MIAHMSQLQFDADTGARLEAAYRARDIVRRRNLVLAALAAEPGEHVIDVGCGPGFYCAELSELVGETGGVLGVDLNSDMLTLARKRCAGRSNVALRQGDAARLPAEDEEFDAATSVQVLEYVRDAPAALREIRRVLRPNGRAVLWDIDWSTLSWRSRDEARMSRVLAAWDAHLTHPTLPRVLATQLRDAGYADVTVEAHAFVATAPTADTYVGAILPIIEAFVAGKAPEDAAAWRGEQDELAESGEFFFSCTQFCFTARRL